jgi:predicted MFS family arabinose efflux permease
MQRRFKSPAPAALTLARPYSRGYTHAILGLLLLVNTFNFIDRTIVATLGQAIKVDLRITDAQLGLIQGLAFALFYTLLGLPLARLSERYNRVTIVAVCLALWSGMTALCGSAHSYLQLFLYRVGVGVGEAGCAPPAQSLITDLYPASARATALSIFSFGISLGTMLGAASGGWIAQNIGWRVAFVVVGLPGVLLAIILKLVVREPARGMAEPRGAERHLHMPPIRAVAKKLFGASSFVHITIGATLTSFVGYGAGTFAQPYFIRMFHLSYAEVGLVFGVLNGISVGVGTILGGALADWAGKRKAKWYALIPAAGVLLATPCYIFAYTRETWAFAAWLLLLPGLFHYSYVGPTLGVMHNLVEPRMRATATALFFLVLTPIALGIGPYFTGKAIDLFSGYLFAKTGFGDFLSTCPGGAAPAGSSFELGKACAESLALGTRYGLILTMLIFIWASLHYLLAARRVSSDLEAAQSTRLG